MAFPTLSIAAPCAWEQSYLDNTLRSPKEGGYVQTRPRHTRKLRTASCSWRGLTNSDKTALESFISGVNICADMFDITALDGTTWTVRMTAPPKFTPIETKNLWQYDMQIEEV